MMLGELKPRVERSANKFWRVVYYLPSFGSAARVTRSFVNWGNAVDFAIRQRILYIR